MYSVQQLHQDSQLKRFFNLWACIYVLIYILTSQFIPRQSFYEEFVTWTGRIFFHKTNLKRVFNGSGDTTFDYILIFTNIVTSYFLSLIILCIDYKRKSYKQLYLFTIVIARYYVAYSLFAYGITKLFFGQFPPNSAYRLDEQIGNMTPMGIVWTFMGTSPGYVFISGLLETVGGLLLLFRRTKTFGALFSMTVMINVALLNYLYDVPVKIFSTHLVLLCVFILTYEWRILFCFFIKHRNVKLDYNKTLVKNKWLQIALRIVKILLIVYILKDMVIRNYNWYVSNEWNTDKDFYVCTQFVLNNNDTIPVDASKKDSIRWNKMVMWDTQTLYVVRNNDSLKKFSLINDTLNKTLDIKNQGDARPIAWFKYLKDNNTLFLYGRINNVPANLVLQKRTKKDYWLPNAKFHWINEAPNNR